jgi:uncharacterized membrane protein YfcA
MENLFPLLVIVFFSNLVEACAGFGATILAVIFGAQFMTIEEMIPILVPLNLLLSATIVARHRGHLDRPALLRRILPLAGIGMPVGMIIFRYAPSSALKVAFGAIVACLGIFELLVASRSERRRLPEWQGALFLLCGVIMQGLFASGGPFVVYYASREIADKSRFRTTLSFLWLILNTVLATSLAVQGKITPETLRSSLFLLPSVLLGMAAGMKVHARVSESSFRRGVYALLVLAGTSLAWRASRG